MEEEKRLLAIMGSPKKGGKTAAMLSTAVYAAKKAGYQIEVYDLYGKNIGCCLGCMKCRESGVCVQHDDLDELREKLIACDMAVLAAPTYFANVPAPVKAIFDRLAGTVLDDSEGMAPKPRLKAGKRYLLLTACSTPSPFDRLAGQSSGCLRAMDVFFHSAGMRCAGKIVCAGTKSLTQLPQGIERRIRRVFRPLPQAQRDPDSVAAL